MTETAIIIEFPFYHLITVHITILAWGSDNSVSEYITLAIQSNGIFPIRQEVANAVEKEIDRRYPRLKTSIIGEPAILWHREITENQFINWAIGLPKNETDKKSTEPVHRNDG